MNQYKKYLDDYISSGKHINGLHRWMKNDVDRLSWLQQETSYLPESAVYDQRLWHVVNNVLVVPTCPICGSGSKWRKYNMGYDKTCGSKACIDKRRIDLRSVTNLEKYGHVNAGASESIQNKIKDTNLKKYGVENVFSLKEIQDKIEDTNIKKYGVRRPLQNEEILNKSIDTNLKKYGVENVMQNPDISEKSNETNIKKYGFKRGSMHGDVKNKQMQTNIEKYGGISPMHSKEVKDLMRSNNVEKYGVPHVMQNDDIRQRYFDTMMERYGVKHPYEYNEFMEKAKKSWMERYNVDNPNKSDQVLLHRKYNKIIDINNDNVPKHIKILDIVDHQKYEIECNNCDNKSILYTVLFNYRKRNDIEICPVCNPISDTTSEKHKAISSYLDSIGINHRHNVKGFLINSRELDIYAESYNVGIEFNGLYWHSNIFKDDYDHQMKTDECFDKGIHLIHIWEDQWDNKPDIIKSRLKTLFNKVDYKYSARKLQVKNVEYMDSKKFLEENHIQGNINGSVRLGLYSGDELVSIMVFGKMRKIMGRDHIEGCWELLRFCSKNNTVVRGGASKLISHFKRLNPDWAMIISYADRSWSKGDLYDKLGFEYYGNTVPNIWFINGGKREHRFNYTKSTLIAMGGNPDKTSKEMAKDLGLTWFCDAGSKRYVMINKEKAQE